jgi:hypothetical protein
MCAHEEKLCCIHKFVDLCQIWKQYWAVHQRFFKQMCVAAKVAFLVEDAQRAIQDGHCVVIGLQVRGAIR